MKQVGLALLDSTKMVIKNWTASCVITGNLVASLRVQEGLRRADHAACMRKGREEVRKRNTLRLDEAFSGSPVRCPCSVPLSGAPL